MNTRKIDYEKLKSLYKKGISITSISIELGCARPTVFCIISKLKKQGIIIRRVLDLKKQGELHNRAKITEKQARKIILLRLKGLTYKEIGEKFKIHGSHARYICIGKSWKYLYGIFEGELKEVARLKKLNQKTYVKN